MRAPAPVAAKTERLVIANINALLVQQHKSQKALALWCRNTEAWLSAILRGRRRLMLYDLDRMADFFGLMAYQLFTPGIDTIYDRRRRDRRSGGERRGRVREAAKQPRLQWSSAGVKKTHPSIDAAATDQTRTAATDSEDITRTLADVEGQIGALREPQMAAPHRSGPAAHPRPSTISRSPARRPRKPAQ